jgi:hypothetical protein
MATSKKTNIHLLMLRLDKKKLKPIQIERVTDEIQISENQTKSGDLNENTIQTE